MCIKKNDGSAAPEKTEKDVALKEKDIDEVSGGVKWGDGERPTLQDAQNKERKRRKK